jgi:hypothetical protein
MATLLEECAAEEEIFVMRFYGQKDAIQGYS